MVSQADKDLELGGYLARIANALPAPAPCRALVNQPSPLSARDLEALLASRARIKALDLGQLASISRMRVGPAGGWTAIAAALPGRAPIFSTA